jgi:ArsR family transcriptional regulator
MLEQLLSGLRASAEPSRLRLLALCADSELAVSDLVRIVGQSQPRVSRHLKVLCDAGLLERHREGSWAYYRLAQHPRSGGLGPGALAQSLIGLLPEDDPVIRRDRERLDAVKAERAALAEDYFRKAAPEWDRIRSLHVGDLRVEEAIGDLLPTDGVEDLLDIGTGTGRMIELFGERCTRAVGVDMSREMLTVARSNLERTSLSNWSLRQGDMYELPMADATFGVAIIHQVLHFAEHPDLAISEAARVLRPGGQLIVVDFSPHELEELRDLHYHRRLGFADEAIDGWFRKAGLEPHRNVHLPGEPLTVSLWSAMQPAADTVLPSPTDNPDNITKLHR